MRYIVYGVGALGGVVAAALMDAGHAVTGIARGKRLAALQAQGLLLRSHAGARRVPLHCVSDPADAQIAADDVILLVTKTQDTPEALERLRAAGVVDQPVFCVQNGVENERLALRRFANVHGVCVMLPAEYLQPDEAIALGAPLFGYFSIGRYPGGHDTADITLAQALTLGGIAGFVDDRVMERKYGKLILNLHNAVEAALGQGAEAKDIIAALRDEAETVLRAAGIAWRHPAEADPPRHDLFSIAPIEGVARTGGSSTQSLARGAGSIESDFLNGEIALIARLSGQEAPLNARLASLAARLARDRCPPGTLTPTALRGALGL